MESTILLLLATSPFRRGFEQWVCRVSCVQNGTYRSSTLNTYPERTNCSRHPGTSFDLASGLGSVKLRPMRLLAGMVWAYCIGAAVVPGRSLGAETRPVLELWPGKAPDELAELGPERTRLSPALERKQVEVTEQTRLITDVSKPTITLFQPSQIPENGTAILICPGGGYWDLYWQLEGEEVAAWLNSIGVTGIVLKYRVPRRADEPKGEPARRPLQDAQRAVSLVRGKARAWKINPERIGIVGFSAGGHLAVATATSFDRRTYAPVDEIDQISCRPNFAIPVYSGYLMAKEKSELAPGLRIPEGTPPMFLAHGGEDIISSPEHSVLMYLALQRAGVSAELHIYAGAAHDFGIRRSGRPCSTWTDSCVQWLRAQGFLSTP